MKQIPPIMSADQIEELLVAQPFAPFYRFVVNHGNMGRGASKGGNAQLEKQYSHFGQSLRERWMHYVYFSP